MFLNKTKLHEKIAYLIYQKRHKPSQTRGIKHAEKRPFPRMRFFFDSHDGSNAREIDQHKKQKPDNDQRCENKRSAGASFGLQPLLERLLVFAVARVQYAHCADNDLFRRHS